MDKRTPEKVELIADEGVSILLKECGYRIASDNLNYILQKKKVGKNKNGESVIRFANEAYYDTLESLFIDLFEKRIRTSRVTSMTALSKRITQAKNEIRQLVKALEGK